MNYANPFNTGIENFVPLVVPGIKEDMYLISDIGNIYNKISGKFLSHAISYANGGYHTVGLQRTDNGRKMLRVHILVAMHFIPKTEEDIRLGRNFVNHKDCNPHNNCWWNLEWVTNQENVDHAIFSHNILEIPVYNNQNKELSLIRNSNWSNGSLTNGQNNGMSRLTEDQVITICEELDRGLRPGEIAKKHLSGSYNDEYIVRGIEYGKRWKHISKAYSFVSESNKKKYGFDLDLKPGIKFI